MRLRAHVHTIHLSNPIHIIQGIANENVQEFNIDYDYLLGNTYS